MRMAAQSGCVLAERAPSRENVASWRRGVGGWNAAGPRSMRAVNPNCAAILGIENRI
jgi:hypothetical protein